MWDIRTGASGYTHVICGRCGHLAYCSEADADVAEGYKGQPLAQDWARVAKVTEEAGEAIDALIGVTGQNPRKGFYGSWDDLDDELCDVALTALYALQHFKKNPEAVTRALLRRARYHHQRVQAKTPPIGRGQTDDFGDGEFGG
jgi:NTP pyrophosphatase (non-canonical NTP hydrolase)